MSVIHIFSHGAEHTTARHFERVAHADGNSTVHYWSCCPKLDKLKTEDIFVFIDPAPDWPIGIESLPCLTIAYFIDVHRDLDSRLQMSQFFDAVFVAQKDYVSSFMDAGHEYVSWLPLACDPKIHNLSSERRIYDIGFVGKLGQKGTQRNKILTAILPCYKTNDYNQPYLYLLQCGEVYSQSKIVFNTSINGDVNMRIFEAMAAGAMLITDRIENGLGDLFEEGINYIAYSTVEEAIEKIDFYLNNDYERRLIAVEGQRIVLEYHTFLHRWEQIVNLSADKYGEAPARAYSRRELGELYSGIFASLRMPSRILSVIFHYGLSIVIVNNWLTSIGKWLNVRIPFTHNAIRARLRK